MKRRKNKQICIHFQNRITKKTGYEIESEELHKKDFLKTRNIIKYAGSDIKAYKEWKIVKIENEN